LAHVGFEHVYGEDHMVHKRPRRPDVVFENFGSDVVSPHVWLLTDEDSAMAPDIDLVPEGAGGRPEDMLEAVPIGPELTDEQGAKVEDTVRQFHDVWATKLLNVKASRMATHKIAINREVKLSMTPRRKRITPQELVFPHEQTKKLLGEDMTTPVTAEDTRRHAQKAFT
jgi:hypothetical protein